MNKELVKNNKEAFDHWLNGGELLIRNNDEDIWINMTEANWDMNYKTVSIIINDEFSELRKALCDGKTVQAYYKFNDTWNDIIKPEFKDNVSNYRIKPEEHKFKIGDFVRHRHSKTCHIVTNINQGEFSDKISTRPSLSFDDDFSSEYIKWTPSHKELCYFTHDTNTKTSATLREFREISKDGFYVDCFGFRFIYCEPFLSSKPSWFND